MNVHVQVELSAPAAVALAPRLQAIDDEPEVCFAVTASRLSMAAATTATSSSSSLSAPKYAAIFLPATITESALDGRTDLILTDHDDDNNSNNHNSAAATKKHKFSKRLLAMVHPFLAENFSIKGLIQVRNNGNSHHNQQVHAPADVALVDLSHTPASLLQELFV